MPELSKVIVTPMRPEEAEAVSALVAEIISALPYYNERARREEVAKYTPERLRSLVAEEPEAVLLARANHDVCGFAISHYDDGLIWIAWFGVRPDWRRRGIGTQLLAAVEETAPRRRAHKIWCDTRTENLISQQLLKKAGYKKIATLTNHWYGQDFYLWEKPLP
ncbi:MAG: GNAT family N-acetyltransferase [Gemmatales bacterium]|nr:GNAT family N-acetyltransferase [Gemmatales bacterium]